MPKIPWVGNKADPDHRRRGEQARDGIARFDQSAGNDQRRADRGNGCPIRWIKGVGIEEKNRKRDASRADESKVIIDEGRKPANGQSQTRYRPAQYELPSARRHYVK